MISMAAVESSMLQKRNFLGELIKRNGLTKGFSFLYRNLDFSRWKVWRGAQELKIDTYGMAKYRKFTTETKLELEYKYTFSR